MSFFDIAVSAIQCVRNVIERSGMWANPPRPDGRIRASRHSRLIAVVAFVGLFIAACASQSSSKPSAAATPGPAAAADTTVPAQLRFTAKTIDGQDFSGQRLLGEPAVLWFWTPWCPTCQGEAPMVARIAAAHPAVTFVGVAGLDEVPSMQQFATKYSLNGFTNLADTDGFVWANFGVTQQPAFAFIRPDGSISVVKGGLSERDLNQRVAALGTT